MRRIQRRQLPREARDALAELQESVNASPEPAKTATALWNAKRATANRRSTFDDVVSTLRRMSNGRDRCMYCEDSEGTSIDHFRPKAKYPQSAFRWRNYLWACAHCNSNEKRDQFPVDAKQLPLLLDPSADDPYEHIVFVPETGEFQGVTVRGAETVKSFGLNRRGALVRGRQNAWTTLTALLRDYGKALRDGDAPTMRRLRDCIRELSFQAVVHHYFRDALHQRESIPSDVRAIVRRSAADWDWAT